MPTLEAIVSEPRKRTPAEEIELDRIVGPQEFERLSAIAWKTFRRNHRTKILQLSRRRYGARVRDVLMLDEDEED